MNYNLMEKDMIIVNVEQSPDAKESLSPRLIPFLSWFFWDITCAACKLDQIIRQFSENVNLFPVGRTVYPTYDIHCSLVESYWDQFVFEEELAGYGNPVFNAKTLYLCST